MAAARRRRHASPFPTVGRVIADWPRPGPGFLKFTSLCLFLPQNTTRLNVDSNSFLQRGVGAE